VKDAADKSAAAHKHEAEAHATHIRDHVVDTTQDVKNRVNDKIDEHKHDVRERRPA
jgi:hypothetical protein